ncbi:solute carrier family 35 member F6 [Cotesia glomerata]|uniref:Solute carrier family 35 member F6 n=1 Tax=Cotesia glomerata TaxID=32391 RepID=A0AAV7HRM4_COTGL|nr:solute carrier family 35 member F6 [Cotesia glomerata]KAH0546823.1 hypothetical protein KQX54_015431 [Cotesia glomerata]
MAWTNYQKFLALLMVVTGSFNTLSVKYSDRLIVPGADGQPRHFNHPFIQSSFMFLGEMSCLLIFKIIYVYYNRLNDGSVDSNRLTKGSRNFNPLIFVIPALCDMIATSIMYVGLNLTYASSFQMLRGSVIVFTGILSMGFLDRKLGTREWSGIGMVIFGLALVGVSDLLISEQTMDKNSIITGDLLIISAQVITAVQMVVEEKFLSGLDIPPLQAVGWEGIFGFLGIVLAIIPFNYIKADPPFADNSQGTLEAPIDAFIQIGNSGRLFMSIIGIMLSIAFFNFAGISVTKEMSATTRMILDSIRTITIWIFSIIFQWQELHYVSTTIQLFGFTILLIGTSFYNNVLIPQLLRKCQSRLGRHRPPRTDEVRVINPTNGDQDIEDNR